MGLAELRRSCRGWQFYFLRRFRAAIGDRDALLRPALRGLGAAAGKPPARADISPVGHATDDARIPRLATTVLRC
jgi:hypothetical protein